MTDLSNIKAEVTSAATAEVAVAESKLVTFVKAHVPTVIAAIVGYAGGSFGVIGAVLKHVL